MAEEYPTYDLVINDEGFKSLPNRDKRVVLDRWARSAPQVKELDPQSQIAVINRAQANFPDPEPIDTSTPQGRISAAGTYAGMMPVFGERLKSFIEASGGRLKITDGARTLAQQEDVFRRKPGLAAKPSPHAPHVRGVAADLEGDLEWAAQNAAKFGLHFPMGTKRPGHKYEPWHVQLLEGAGTPPSTPVQPQGRLQPPPMPNAVQDFMRAQPRQLPSEYDKVSPDELAKVRMRFFNTDNPKANVPMVTAHALAKNPNDQKVIDRLKKMQPVTQVAILQKADELSKEAELNKHTTLVGGGYDPSTGYTPPTAMDLRTGMPVIKRPSEAIAEAIRGPEGAKILAQTPGFFPAAEKFLYSLADPEQIGLAIGTGGIASIAPKLLPLISAGFAGQMGMAAKEKWDAGDRGGALFDALMAGLAGAHATHGTRQAIGASRSFGKNFEVAEPFGRQEVLNQIRPPKGANRAVQEPEASGQVSRAGETGQNIPEGGAGIRPGVKGPQVTETGVPEVQDKALTEQTERLRSQIAAQAPNVTPQQLDDALSIIVKFRQSQAAQSEGRYTAADLLKRVNIGEIKQAVEAARKAPAKPVETPSLANAEVTHGETSTIEGTRNSSGGDAEFFSNLTGTPSFSEQSLRSLDVPTQRVVMSRVLSALHDLKVRDAVVKFVPVDVVDTLISLKPSAEVRLHDPAVSPNLLPIRANDVVSLPTDIAYRLTRAISTAKIKLASSARVGNKTRLGAEDRLTSSGIRRVSEKGDSTGTTGPSALPTKVVPPTGVVAEEKSRGVSSHVNGEPVNSIATAGAGKGLHEDSIPHIAGGEQVSAALVQPPTTSAAAKPSPATEMPRFESEKERSAVLRRVNEYSSVPVEGATRDQAKRFFEREAAAKAASQLKYKDGMYAKTLIDNLFEDGAKVEQRGAGMALVMPGGKETPFRRKVEMDYIKVVANQGNLARNYELPAEPLLQRGEPPARQRYRILSPDRESEVTITDSPNIIEAFRKEGYHPVPVQEDMVQSKSSQPEGPGLLMQREEDLTRPVFHSEGERILAAGMPKLSDELLKTGVRLEYDGVLRWYGIPIEDQQIERGQFKDEIAKVRAEVDAARKDILPKLALPTPGKLNESVTPEFRKWFGDSVMVDHDGNPSVVYHGTTDAISEFDLDHPNRLDAGTLGTGVYLTDSPRLAASYATHSAEVKKGYPSTLPLFAKLENPYIASTAEREHIQSIGHEQGKEAGKRASDAFAADLKSKGHDGVILVLSSGAREIVVFDPKQVKSAIGNRGTFDPENPNLLMQGQKGANGEPKAAIQFEKDFKSTIQFFEKADVSSINHEFMHDAVDIQRHLAEEVGHPQAIQDYDTLSEFAGATKDGGKWSWGEKAHEKVARAWERYLHDGVAPTEELRGVFDRMKSWLKEIYQRIKGSSIDVKLTPEVREYFDRMLGKEAEPKAETTTVKSAESESVLPIGNTAKPTPKRPRPVMAAEGATSARNAVSNAEREDLGLNLLDEPERKARQVSIDNAMQKGYHEPDRSKAIAESVIGGKEKLDDEKQAGLAVRKLRLIEEYNGLLAEANNTKDPAELARLKTETADKREQFDLITTALKRGGTELGRALAFRASDITPKYEALQMLAEAKIAKGGELTTAESDKVAELSRELMKAQKAIETHEARQTTLEGRIADLEARQAVTRMEKDVAKERRTSRGGKSKTLKELASQLGGRKTLHQDADVLYQFGEIDPEDANILRDMAKSVVSEGVKDANEIVKRVHEAAEPHMEGIEPREVRDAISGYGEVKTGTTDPIELKFQQASRAMRLISQLEDVQIGIKPQASGFRPQPDAPDVAALRAELSEALKAAGMREPWSMSDAQRQKAIQTRLEARITELNRRIKASDFSRPGKRVPAPSTPEMERLKTERDRLTKQLADMKPESVLNAERLDRYKPILQKAIEDYEKRITDKDFVRKTRAEIVLDAETKKLKDKRDNLRNQWEAEKRKLEPKSRFKRLNEILASNVLLNPVSRVIDVAANTAKVPLYLASNPVRASVGYLLDRSLYKGMGGGRERFITPGTIKDVLRGSKDRWKAEAKQTLEGTDPDAAAKYGRGTLVTRATGMTDVPFKDFYARIALHDMAKQKAEMELGPKASKEALQTLTRKYLENPDDQMMLVAHEWALRQTFNFDNLMASGVSAIKAAVQRHMTKQFGDKPGGAGETAADGINLALDTVMRFSRVIGNVALERAEHSFPAYSGTMAAVKALQTRAHYTPSQARVVADLAAKGLVGYALVQAGRYAAQNGWYAPDAKKLKNGTVILDDGDLSQIGGPLSPFLYGAQMEAIERLDLTEKQRDQVRHDSTYGLFLNQPAFTGPKRLSAATESDKGMVKWLGQTLAAQTVPGGVREWAKRQDAWLHGLPFGEERLVQADTVLDQYQKSFPFLRDTMASREYTKLPVASYRTEPKPGPGEGPVTMASMRRKMTREMNKDRPKRPKMGAR